MTDLLRLVSEADGGTRAVPHLSKYIDFVWAAISSYIEQQMISHKGVCLSGLGTFTLSQQILSEGNQLTQRPIFILAGKLVRSLGLKQTWLPAAAAHLPVVQLNFVAVSRQTPFSRDAVESCVRQTLGVLYKALFSEKNVFLIFTKIGVLWFKNNKVQMKFNRDFLMAVSGTNKQSDSRAGGSVSSLSGALSKLQRRETANPVALPTVCSSQPENKAGGKDGGDLLANTNRRSAGEVPQQSQIKSGLTLQVKAVAPEKEELNSTPPMEATNKYSTHNDSQSHSLDGAVQFAEMSRLQSGLIPGPNISISSHGAPPKLDHHLELCYRCTQRALKNIPEYRREQQQAEEKAQETLLLLREQQRDLQGMKQELTKLMEQREHAKQVAAFNLQMSEKRKKDFCFDFPGAFIFQTRPLTPPRRIQQLRYMNELQNQVEIRQKHEAHDQQNQRLLEHHSQAWLLQELASHRAQQLQQKQQKTKHYRKALDMQVEGKKCMETSDPACENPRSHRCGTAVGLAESRERAQKLFQINFSAATQKKKEEQQNHQLQLETERAMLKHDKVKSILDRVHHLETKHNIRKSLEDEWRHSVRLKQKRDDEERSFLRSAGQLLVDKIEEYSRCSQCKRRTTNCGESNIWKDSHFLSGSQFMI